MDSLFNESNSTIISHVTDMTLQNTSTFTETEGLSNFIIGTLMMIINGLLIISLFNQRRNVNWKRFACILNLAISDFICGSVLMFRGLTDLTRTTSAYGLDLLDTILSLEVCASIIMTILNYDCQLCIQYLAIKKPIFYRTKLTLTNIVTVIGVLWVIILTYTVLKIILTFLSNWSVLGLFFTCVDVTAMGLSLMFNSIFYTHVLKVATQKMKEILTRRQLSDKSTASGDSELARECKCKRKCKQSIFCQYNSVITLGIQLITYIATVSPLFVFWIYSAIFHNGTDMLDPSGKVINTVLESFWFVRAILDPLTFLYRERHLLLTNKSHKVSINFKVRNEADRSVVE